MSLLALLRIIALFSFIAIFASVSLSALSFATDYTNVRMTSCTSATVYAYADNPSGSNYSLAISTYPGKLMASVDTPIQQLPAYQSRGTSIRIYSNQCFKGNEDVIIYYQTCKDAKCTVQTSKVRVDVEPCTSCKTYIEQYLPASPGWTPADPKCIGTGCGEPLISDAYFEDEFNPSGYGATLSLPTNNYKTVAGAKMEVDAVIKNTESPATFDLALDGFVNETGAYLPQKVYGLDSGQSATVPIVVNIPSDRTGSYCIALSAYREGIELDTANACFDVFDNAQARASAPSEISVSKCGNTANYTISVSNDGASANAYSIASTSAAVKNISQNTLYVNAGSSGFALVVLDTAKLSGSDNIQITVTGDRTNDLSGIVYSQTLTTVVKSTECLANETVDAGAGMLISINETVKNPTTAMLTGVTATIEGLPSDYVVMQKEPSGVDITPGATATLTIIVQTPKDATTANGMLVVKDSNGRIISQRPVVVSALGNGGITGFFTKAVGGNLLGIALLLILAIAVAMTYVKKNETKQTAKAGNATAAKTTVVQTVLTTQASGDSATVTK